MSDFEGINSLWDQVERGRHAALLRQLKAELQEHRRQTNPTRPTPPLLAPKEQPAQPEPGIRPRVRL